MIDFICDRCKERNHKECPGKSWCDCQCKVDQ